MVTKLSHVENDLMLPILAIMPTFPARYQRSYEEAKVYSRAPWNLLTDTRHGFKESYRILRTKLILYPLYKTQPQ